MYLQVFPTGPLLTNAILLACEKTKQAAFIDPAVDSASFFEQEIKSHQLQPKMILLTHSHWDHIADVALLKKKFNLPVFVEQNDVDNLRDPGADRLPLAFPIEGVEPDHILQDQQVIELGDLKLKVLHTPGHSEGGVCFYIEKEKTLISGDTLFKESIGKVSFPKSNPKKMWNSCKILAKLPADTRVVPGHGPETTIGDEPWLLEAEKYFS